MLRGLEQNVCFLHNQEGSGLTPQFLLHCDWCGLINGLVHTALENAEQVAVAEGAAAADAALDGAAAAALAAANAYLGGALSLRSERWAAGLRDEDVAKFCAATFGEPRDGGDGHDCDNLLALARLHLLGTAVELVWCPFKRAREDHYRSLDGRFQRVPSVAGERDHYADMSRLLAEGPPTECAQCAAIVNQSFYAAAAPGSGLGQSNDNSICQPLLTALAGGEGS